MFTISPQTEDHNIIHIYHDLGIAQGINKQIFPRAAWTSTAILETGYGCPVQVLTIHRHRSDTDRNNRCSL